MGTPEGGTRRETIDAASLELERDPSGVFPGRWLVFRDAERRELGRFDVRNVLAMGRVE